MSTFDFRIRLNFSEHDHLESDEKELLLFEEQGGPKIVLRSGAMDKAIKELPRIAIQGSPYLTSDEAERAALLAKQSVLRWATKQRFGVDFGDGHLRSYLTEAGLKYFGGLLNQSLRNDIHGIDVFETQPGLKFAHSETNAQLGKSITTFLSEFRDGFQAPLNLSAKQIVSAELFLSSFFDKPIRSRFITLVTAIEALLVPSDQPQLVISIVQNLERIVDASALDQPSKQSLLGSIAWLRKKSITKTGQELSNILLNGKKYHGFDPGIFFRECYNLRSQIVHSGKIDNSQIDILEWSNDCQIFVGDLLESSFKNATA